jgi:hypothetical protein
MFGRQQQHDRPDNLQPDYSCAGQSGNCGGANHNNNPKNPPNTAP